MVLVIIPIRLTVLNRLKTDYCWSGLYLHDGSLGVRT